MGDETEIRSSVNNERENASRNELTISQSVRVIFYGLGVNSGWVSTLVGCQPWLGVNSGWVSTPVGCQLRLGVNSGWVSTPVGCQLRLGVNSGLYFYLN
jgi:hypothetical protein